MTNYLYRLLALTSTMLLISVLTAGCNTIEGAGEDIEAAGAKIEDTAEKKKTY